MSKTEHDSMLVTSEKIIPIQSSKGCCEKRGFKRGIFCHHRSCAKSNDYRVCLEMKQFKLEDIVVRTKELHIIVEAKNESEEFSQRYELPDGYDPNTLTSYFNGKGKLIIKASKYAATTVDTEMGGESFMESKNKEEADAAEEKEEST